MGRCNDLLERWHKVNEANAYGLKGNALDKYISHTTLGQMLDDLGLRYELHVAGTGSSYYMLTDIDVKIRVSNHHASIGRQFEFGFNHFNIHKNTDGEIDDVVGLKKLYKSISPMAYKLHKENYRKQSQLVSIIDRILDQTGYNRNTHVPIEYDIREHFRMGNSDAYDMLVDEFGVDNFDKTLDTYFRQKVFNEADQSLDSMSKEELQELKNKIRKQSFLSPEDMQQIREIDSLLVGFHYSGEAGKIKKSKRVTPFTRNRE